MRSDPSFFSKLIDILPALLILSGHLSRCLDEGGDQLETFVNIVMALSNAMHLYTFKQKHRQITPIISVCVCYPQELLCYEIPILLSVEIEPEKKTVSDPNPECVG